MSQVVLVVVGITAGMTRGISATSCYKHARKQNTRGYLGRRLDTLEIGGRKRDFGT